MKVTLNVPNDFGSDADTVNAIADCYDGDNEAAVADGCREFFEVLAAAAVKAGLQYIESTGSGAVWEGTDAQFQACRAALPAWAKPYASPVEDKLTQASYESMVALSAAVLKSALRSGQ